MAELPSKEGDRVRVKGINIPMTIDSINVNTWACTCIYYDNEAREFKFVTINFPALELIQ